MSHSSTLHIRKAKVSDWEAIWPFFYTIIQTGDTYVFPPDFTESEAKAYWFHVGTQCYVALWDNAVAGTYILKPNQIGLGSHISNGSYMVHPRFQGLGLGRAMGEHSIVEAKNLGFQAIQFNMVVSTNAVAVKLWESLGFQRIGIVPKGFKHLSLGYVDAYIMFRTV